MNKDDKNLSIDIAAGASLKAEVKTEVPPESAGRFLDALTDIIRPFSESRGLRGDQIRLQREEVLIEVAHLARQRIEAERIEVKTVPNRILVPFLERASLVEMDDKLLIDLWSQLLVSISHVNSPNYPIFIDILAKLDLEHVRLMKKIRTDGPIGYFESAPDDFGADGSKKNFFRFLQSNSSFSEESSLYTFNGDLQDVCAFIHEEFVKPGIGVEYFCCGSREEHLELIDSLEVDETITQSLEALGIFQSFKVDENDILNCPVQFTFFLKVVAFTRFGIEFFNACNPTREEQLDA